MKIVSIILGIVLLSSCSIAPSLIGPALSYVASVNNVGVQTLKFVDDKNNKCMKPDEKN